MIAAAAFLMADEIIFLRSSSRPSAERLLSHCLCGKS